jgi:hypothetical protein
MPDYEFCEMCGSFDVQKSPDGSYYRCNWCEHIKFPDGNAAEQRNEAISDGQPFFFCGETRIVDCLGESPIVCP